MFPALRALRFPSLSLNLKPISNVRFMENKISSFSTQTFKGIKSMNLERYSVNDKKRTIKPAYADACGNKFLIYDFIKQNATEEVRNQIWDNLQKANHIDDGLLLHRVNDDENHLQVKMHVLEPDRTEADFCGNGARSVGVYLNKYYGNTFSEYSLSSRRGKHEITNKNGTCFINMGKPALDENIINFSFKGQNHAFTFVDAVEPHLVTESFFDEGILEEVGEAINDDLRDRFPHGVNVNCVSAKGDTEIDVLTYERGVYRITQACGTGSTACCATAINHGWISPNKDIYKVNVLGGELEILLNDDEFHLGGSVLIS